MLCSGRCLDVRKSNETWNESNLESIISTGNGFGRRYVNWHADDEKELAQNPTLASVNFGETRDFILRNNHDENLKIKIPLSHGTLLIMKGELQHFWKHAVPKRMNIKNSRFNLTFRVIK